jgi:CheY-like chemotaxis protein
LDPITTQCARMSESRVRRLLLVEDDEAVRRLCRRALGELYQITEADTGGSALQAFRAEPADFVLCDFVLPDMTGNVVREAILDAGFNVQILMMSGYAREFLEERGYPPGAPLLEKPFTPAELRDAVAKLRGAADQGSGVKDHGLGREI